MKNNCFAAANFDLFFTFQAVNSILRHVANILGYKTSDELEELYKKTAWHFEAKTKKRGSSYDYFKQVRDKKMTCFLLI